ncbi:MAG: isoprenyl transferase [Phycisphaerae bacterium]|jgi:undecaprenyl diphosphate synthase
MEETRLDPQEVLGLTREQMPRHIAIIMDGNGRWARARDLPRIKGHERGARTVRTIITHCAKLGVEVVTLYSFSSENWKRPKREVDFLMDLYVRSLIAERETIMKTNIRFVHLGRRDNLPQPVLTEMDKTIDMSRNNSGLTLCVAINYGSRDEIVDAVRRIATDVQDGRLAPDEIDKQHITDSLNTAGLPDPDLLIRTANERRVSNFLLWQISYAEIHVSQKLWPDFGVEDLEAAIKDFADRERRFGAVDPSSGASGML